MAKAAAKRLSKSQLTQVIAERSNLKKGDVASVLEQLSNVALEELSSGSDFQIPNLAKMRIVRKPAVKAHRGVNPFTKEEMDYKAKPARNLVKIKPLSAVKDAV